MPMTSQCVNCNAAKEELYEPYCSSCNLAVAGVREYAEKENLGRDLFNKLKSDTLAARANACGMHSKMRPDGDFERAPNPEQIANLLSKEVRAQEEEMLDLRKRFGV